MRWGAVSGRLGGRLKLDCKKRLKNKKYKKINFKKVPESPSTLEHVIQDKPCSMFFGHSHLYVI